MPNSSSLSFISEGNDLGLGANGQGVAYDGTYYYFSTSEGIYKYTRSGATYTLDSSSATVRADVQTDVGETVSQINGMDYHSGALWVGASNFPTSPKKSWIAEVNPSTFAITNTYAIEAGHTEGGAWHDVGSGNEFWAIYHDRDVVARYNASFVLQSEYSLPLYSGETDNLSQSAAWVTIAGTHYLITPRHNSNDRQAIDIHQWTGSGFTAVKTADTITYERAGVTQGSHWESTGTPGYGDVMLICRRFSGGRIIRAEFVEGPDLAPSFKPFQNAVTTDSPLVAYMMNDPAPATGSPAVAIDSAGSPWRDGLYENGPTLAQTGLTNDDNAAAVEFTGASFHSLLREGDEGDASAVNTALAGVSAMTVEAIFKADGFSNVCIASKHDSGTSGEFYLGFLSATSVRFATVNPTPARDDFDITISALSTGTTYYLAATWDGSTKRVYLGEVGADDFAELDNKAWAAANLRATSFDLQFGRISTNVWPFDGIMGGGAFYDTALSEVRLQAHFDAITAEPSSGGIQVATGIASGLIV